MCVKFQSVRQSAGENVLTCRSSAGLRAAGFGSHTPERMEMPP